MDVRAEGNSPTHPVGASTWMVQCLSVHALLNDRYQWWSASPKLWWC